MLIGRACELDRLARGLAGVPVALICGVPGVGKSALAHAHAATWPGPVACVQLSAGASIAQLAATVHHWLGMPDDDLALGDLAPDNAAQLDGLWALVDGSAALLVLDDLHCLAPALRSLIVNTAAQRLRDGRLIATSRELVPILAGMPDRVQLRLDGLDRAGAAQLWERLLDLYGPASDFEAAWRRSLGHPYLLRQAHVATQSGDDPVIGLMRSLDPGQRRIAGALALSCLPLPCGLVARLAPAGAAPALDALVTRLIVDVTADGAYAMRDLLREAVLQTLDASAIDELRAALVDALQGSDLDAVTVLQESARHLRALGRHAELARLLVAEGARLVRQGITAALLHEIDAIPAEACGPALQRLRDRTLARSLQQARRAFERGERGAALERYRSLADVMDRSGFIAGAVWARACVGRILLAFGRRREALAVLSAAVERGRIARAAGLHRAIENMLDDDPLSPGWLSHDAAVPPSRAGELLRARVRAVLRHACSGDAPRAHPLHVDVVIPASAEFAFDRALLALARALLAARQGRVRLAARHLEAATRWAAEGQADPDLVPALYDRFRSEPPAAAGDAPTTAPGSLVIDGVHHEVTDGAVRVPLASRAVLRRLLYAFVIAEGHSLDCNAIARTLWHCDYTPPRHNSSLKSNIRRLRELLEGTRAVIQSDQDGYRLSVPPGSVLVPPSGPDA